MKKKLLVSFLCPIFLISLTACDNAEESYTVSTEYANVQNLDLTSYNEQVSRLIKISPSDYYEIQNQSKTAFVYFGKGSCQYCREFINSLTQTLEDSDSNFEIYYIDTENREEKALVELRNELNIEFVPAFMRVGNGELHQFNENTESINNFLNDL